MWVVTAIPTTSTSCAADDPFQGPAPCQRVFVGNGPLHPPLPPGGAQVLEAPEDEENLGRKLTGAEGARGKMFGWPEARRNIWPNHSSGGVQRVCSCVAGGGGYPTPHPQSGAELSKGALGREVSSAGRGLGMGGPKHRVTSGAPVRARTIPFPGQRPSQPRPSKWHTRMLMLPPTGHRCGHSRRASSRAVWGRGTGPLPRG